MSCESSSPSFQHVQPGSSAYHDSTSNAIDYLNQLVYRLSMSKVLHQTYKIASELQNSAYNLSLLKLEQNLFTDADPSYCDRYGQRELVTQKQALLSLADRLCNSHFEDRYIANMAKAGYECSTQECAARELQQACSDDRFGIGWTWPLARAAIHWAERELEQLNTELNSITSPAKQRMQAYFDHVDITDRFSTYRRNLGCLTRQQVGDDDRQATPDDGTDFAPRWFLGSEWQRSKIIGSQNYQPGQPFIECDQDVGSRVARSKPLDPILAKKLGKIDDKRRRAGIEPDFPGRSEFQDSYINPQILPECRDHDRMPPTSYLAKFQDPESGVRQMWAAGLGDRAHTGRYVINPSPDYLSVFQLPEPNDREKPVLPVSEYSDSFKPIC